MLTKIFISHRQDEKSIADVINKHLQMWGIHSKDIFHSSDTRGGTRIGGQLTNELKNALMKTNLLILVYTHSVYDWSYCMWECGVALDPKTEDTKIVVFECSGETPKVFHSDVRVNVTMEGIVKFTNQFHTDEKFFPGQEAYKSELREDIIEQLGGNLYNDLSEVIPGGRYKEVPLVHRLTLSFSAENVEKVMSKKNLKTTRELICENLLIEEFSPYCPEHFGFTSFDAKMKWSLVVNRWKDEVKRYKAKKVKASESWIAEVHSEIWRAIQKKPAKPEGNILIGATTTNRQYSPLLCLKREYPDKKMEFHLYFYPNKVK